MAHQILINALMRLYILTHISMHSIVSEVKRVTSFTASKELPNSLIEGLLLWVRKISNCNHKVKGVDASPTLHKPATSFNSSDVMEMIRDKQSLTNLLQFYLPDSVKWNGM